MELNNEIELIKLLYKEGLVSSEFSHVYLENAYFIRYKNNLYKSVVNKNSDISTIVLNLKNKTYEYNFIKVSDGTYIDGFVFPEELELDDDFDNYCGCICFHNYESNELIWENFKNYKIDTIKFSKSINELEHLITSCDEESMAI